MNENKKIIVTLSDSTYTELKICAKNLGVTPAKILERFAEDLLSETKEPNTAQRWFWQNRAEFRRISN